MSSGNINNNITNLEKKSVPKKKKLKIESRIFLKERCNKYPSSKENILCAEY